MFARMLQSVLVPILIVSGDEILFRNRAANRFISEGFIIVDGKSLVRFLDPSAQELLDKVRQRRSHSGTQLLRGDGAASAVIMQALSIGRTPAQGRRRAKSDVPVAVFLIQLSHAGAVRKRAIEGFSLFSRTEKEVLAALANGHSVGAIADASARSIATVRWHVKKMLTKTGARSIGDLTRMSALLAPY